MLKEQQNSFIIEALNHRTSMSIANVKKLLEVSSTWILVTFTYIETHENCIESTQKALDADFCAHRFATSLARRRANKHFDYSSKNRVLVILRRKMVQFYGGYTQLDHFPFFNFRSHQRKIVHCTNQQNLQTV